MEIEYCFRIDCLCCFYGNKVEYDKKSKMLIIKYDDNIIGIIETIWLKIEESSVKRYRNSIIKEYLYIKKQIK